jgi:hypothetical protein
MFCAPKNVSGGTEGVGSHFHILRSQTHFGRYRGRRAPFSSFALPDSFLTILRVSGPVFVFCAPRLIFRQYRGSPIPFSYFPLLDSLSVVSTSGPIFMFCAPRLVFGGKYRGFMFCAPGFMFYALRPLFDSTKRVGSNFHVFRSQTCFRRYRGH